MAEHGGLAPHPGWRDDFLSRDTRRAWPVRVPWSRRQDLHPHWTRSELAASALGYAGEKVGWPESGPDAPRGCSRIKLRKIQAGDFPAMLLCQLPQFVLFAVAPAIRLSMTLEPTMALPSTMVFEPAFQFGETAFYRGIDLTNVLDPVAPDLESIERRLIEHPVWLPVAVPMQQQFVSEKPKPFVGTA